jgi:hypothetical protein
MAEVRAKRVRRSAEERLALAEEKAAAAERKAREARAKAGAAKRRVTKMKARLGRAQAKTEARRKIVLGTMLLWARGTDDKECKEFADLMLKTLKWEMSDKDQSLFEGDEWETETDYRKDTQRKAVLGGALLGAARQTGVLGEAAAYVIPVLIRKLDREHDAALFKDWSYAP